MFYSITGQVVYADATSVAVSCGGVAFNCSATANTLKNIGTIGDTVTLYTYLNVREARSICSASMIRMSLTASSCS